MNINNGSIFYLKIKYYAQKPEISNLNHEDQNLNKFGKVENVAKVMISQILQNFQIRKLAN